MRIWALISTAVMLAWLSLDLVQLGAPILAGEAGVGDVMTWAAIAWLALCVATRRPVAPTRPTPSSLAAVIVSATAVPFGLLLTPAAPRESQAGNLLLLAAGGLLAWSAAALGSRFTLLPAALGLQCGGPYRYIRHPMYASYMLGSAGIVLYLPHPMMIAAALVEAGALLARAAAEECVLAAIPGYRQYRAGTPGRFLPRPHVMWHL